MSEILLLSTSRLQYLAPMKRTKTPDWNSLFLVGALLLSSLSATGQRYYSGSIQLTDGRELNGQVAIDSWDQNPTYVLYRADERAEPVRYEPTQVPLLRIEERRYRGAVVEVEHSAAKLDDLRQGKDWNLTTETLFLRYVVEGDRPLLVVEQPVALDQYYMLGADGEPVLLRYKRYLKEAKLELSSVRERRDFVLQLSDLLQDCPEVRTALQGIEYKERDLLAALNADAGCRGAAPPVRLTARKSVRQLRLGGGVNLTDHVFTGVGNQGSAVYQGSPLARPSFLLALDIIPKGGRSNLTFTNEFSLIVTANQPTKIAGQTAEGDPVGLVYLRYSLLFTNNPTARGDSGFLFGVGPVVGGRLIANDGTNRSAAVRNLDFMFTSTRLVSFDTARGELGAAVLAGYVRDRMRLALRIELLSGGYSIPVARSNTQRYSLLFSYRLKE